ncbi:MAG: PIN domain-containing protein [Sporichthyaceae bacterium]
MIVDTSALFAFFDDRDPDHGAVSAAITAATEPLVVSPYIVAELDYLILSRRGVPAEVAALRELAGGAWDLAAFGPADIAKAIEVSERYSDHKIGVADASTVVLAAHHRTRTIATLDRRHFKVLRPLNGGRFTLLP